MKTVFHPSASRGKADHGWLRSMHSFSFAGFHNPERLNFGALRVLNDDIIRGGTGFGTHPHDNMEIISVPISGALKHRDSAGHEEVIRTGEVQIMSAGSGLTHSEMNHSRNEEAHFLQLWIFPKEIDIAPRYEQKKFSGPGFVTAVGNGEAGALEINQDARLVLGNFEAGESAEFEIKHPGNGVYIFVIEGLTEIGDQLLNRRDALGISETEKVSLHFPEKTSLIFVEVPMNFR